MANQPTFTVIMGCNGAGKTTWKRANYARLPARHYDLDAVAGGIGDWNNRETQRRALEFAHAEIDRAIAAGQDFGTETTYAGRRGPGMVQQLREQGYRIEGIYIGTETPDINIERVACVFRSKPITDSGRSRSLIPVEADHPPSELRGAGRPADRETFLLFRRDERWRTGGCPCARFERCCGCTSPPR